jgi:predicted O-methyltransferase YrrM
MKNNYWQTIYGWFDYENVFDFAIEHLKDGDIAVEIGTFLGKSTCYFAQQLKESGKKIKFYACDIFDGSQAPFMPPEWKKPFYDTFLDNIQKQEVSDFIIPLKGNSLDFAKDFEDNSISFLYIDDDHREPHFSKEINLWYPKVKQGGIMAGHDFHVYPEIKEAIIKFSIMNNLHFKIIPGSFSHSWLFINQIYNRV